MTETSVAVIERFGSSLLLKRPAMSRDLGV